MSGEGRALAGLAVQDHVRIALGHRALDARLQIAARYVLGAGKVTRLELVRLADIDHDGAVSGLAVDLGRIDLVDRAADLLDDFGA